MSLNKKLYGETKIAPNQFKDVTYLCLFKMKRCLKFGYGWLSSNHSLKYGKSISQQNDCVQRLCTSVSDVYHEMGKKIINSDFGTF